MKACVMCSSRTALEMFGNGVIDEEKLSTMQENVRWQILSSPHKKRLVCSEACFDEMMVLYSDYKETRAKLERKCLRDSCRHRERMHAGWGGSCTAARCKCLKYISGVNENIADMHVPTRQEQKAIETEAGRKLTEEFNRRKEEMMKNGASNEDLRKLAEEIYNPKETP